MPKKTRKTTKTQNGMRAEYDFSGGVRGKHHRSRLLGYVIRIRKPDGTTEVREIDREGSVVLEPDVRKYFPNSKAVNRALRTLIEIIPSGRT
ncbi:MAG TPA: hypothetical protein VNG71_17300 [Pyrinomonadaceae bacterium]|nr:hypothetical protein [Pyrinomonadaceae bacterium]